MAARAIKLKRAYDAPETEDGFRILVDRLWPRGVSKDKAKIDLWLKEVAPSTELRKWFNHELPKWPAFHDRYFAELDANGELVDELMKHVHHQKVTLVYSAKDAEHNQAVALKEYLDLQRSKA